MSQQSKPRIVSAAEMRQRELQGSTFSSPSTGTQSTPQRITPGRRTPPLPPNVDIRKTKEYKAASRKWVSTIVALPILFYTSWELYERTYGSKVQKSLVDANRKAMEEASSKRS
ncbi:hypothetical protein TMatcc_008683 [Talaromyces marneffei ATCC 18224]|uniref:Uncharacterized protein n=1 Tax=Talaromyces marneffei PM1 TaxID=1077442 RepID=A0A093VQB6_TALMA|nr:uncharacterized protein EYB26_008009 [Talaromyces marneffei]KAE8550637.1 hypothetical protein EYB25_006865 [Talaromyces marneffei]QGA20307.1 hypothetical protein EYB26_008009 [Talaromyces marneffei]